MELLFIYFILSFLVAVWANKWQRSPWAYFFVALILSPFLASLILLIHGRKALIIDVGLDTAKKLRQVGTSDAIMLARRIEAAHRMGLTTYHEQ